MTTKNATNQQRKDAERYRKMNTAANVALAVGAATAFALTVLTLTNVLPLAALWAVPAVGLLTAVAFFTFLGFSNAPEPGSKAAEALVTKQQREINNVQKIAAARRKSKKSAAERAADREEFARISKSQR